MVRSAAAVLALLILPGFALGQEPVGTHTVVIEDTLWDLAMRYYQNPYEWRVIYEANRDSIADPNLIYPREVFVIPGLPGRPGDQVATSPDAIPLPTPVVTDVQTNDSIVATGPEPAPVDLVQFGFRQARPAEQVRSIFYADTAGQRAAVAQAAGIDYVAVTRDAAYSAPWLVPLTSTPESSGTIEGFATEGERASTIRSFNRVRVAMPSPARVGAELQIFRVMGTIPNVGYVVSPTGLLTVSTISELGVVGVVTKEYHRIQPGDFVRPVPTYSVQPGAVAQEISGGSEAMIMGFAGRQVINDLGHVAFLDLGSDDGVVLGDEFVLYGAAVGSPEGSLQVVGVTSNTASARITSMVNNVFHQGVVVRLARKMR